MRAAVFTTFCITLMSSGMAASADRPLETKIVWSTACTGDPKPGTSSKSLFLGALVTAVGPKLISGVVDMAATALKKAGESAEVARSSALTVSRPYGVSKDADLGLSDEHGCLIILRGEFPTSGKPIAEDASASELLSAIKDPTLIFEAHATPLAGAPFFQLEPVRLKIGKFEGESLIGRNEREITIALTFATPGTEAAFAAATFSFVGMKEQTELKRGSWQLAGKRSAPISLPPVPDAGKQAQAKQEAFIAPYVLASALLTAKATTPVAPIEAAPNELSNGAVRNATDMLCAQISVHNKNSLAKFALNDELCDYKIAGARTVLAMRKKEFQSGVEMVAWAQRVCDTPAPNDDKVVSCGTTVVRPVKPSARFGYMTTSATLVETRPGSKFAALLGGALAAAKDDISAAIAKRVVPSQVSAADEAESTAERTARRGVALADIVVTQAEQALAELQADSDSKASAVTAARAVLIRAKIAANDAYRLAGLPSPYPELD